jgi:hypothetical protein
LTIPVAIIRCSPWTIFGPAERKLAANRRRHVPTRHRYGADQDDLFTSAAKFIVQVVERGD